MFNQVDVKYIPKWKLFNQTGYINQP